MVGGALSVAALTAFARLNGGIREVLVAREYGTSAQLEAFLVGFGFVSLVVVAVAGAMGGAVVPTYFRDGIRDEPGRAGQLAGNVLPRLTLLVGAGTLVVALLSPVLPAVLGGGFDDATQDRLREVVLVLSPVICLAGWSQFAVALLNARRRFALGAVPQIANPVTTIAVLVADSSPTSSTLAVAFLAGAVAELVAAVALARAAGIRLAPADPDRGPADRRVFLVTFPPLVAGFAIQASNTVVDQAVASHLETGQVAVLAFGTRIPGFAAAVGMTAVGTVVLPRFSELTAGGERGAMRSAVRRSLVWVAVAGTAGALALSVLATPVVDLVFGGGRFTPDDVRAAASVQTITAWQLPLHLVAVVLLRVLNAHRRQRAVVVAAGAATAVNLVADIVLAQWLGVEGIALATTLTLGVTCAAFGAVARLDLARTGNPTGAAT